METPAPRRRPRTRSRATRWVAWTTSSVVHGGAVALLLATFAGGRWSVAPRLELTPSEAAPAPAPFDERRIAPDPLPPLPPPPATDVPLPEDRPPIDEHEELSEHGDRPLPEGYEYRPETDRWEVILKDPRRRVRNTKAEAAEPPAAPAPAGPPPGALTAPRVTHQPAPKAKPGAAGRVVLRIQVLMNGGVGEVRVVTSSGDAGLDRAAVASVRDWKFVPATLNGLPVATWVEVPIRFAR